MVKSFLFKALLGISSPFAWAQESLLLHRSLFPMGKRRWLTIVDGFASVLTSTDLAAVLTEWGITDSHPM